MIVLITLGQPFQQRFALAQQLGTEKIEIQITWVASIRTFANLQYFDLHSKRLFDLCRYSFYTYRQPSLSR